MQKLLFHLSVLFLGLVSCSYFTGGAKGPSSREVGRFELFENSDWTDAVPQKSDWQNKMVIVNFWASWCAPCRKETPALLKLIALNSSELTLISVSGDAKASEMKSFVRLFPDFKNHGVFLIHDLRRTWIQPYGVTGYPETFLYSKDGKLLRHVKGEIDFNASEWKQFGKEPVISPTKQND